MLQVKAFVPFFSRISSARKGVGENYYLEVKTLGKVRCKRMAPLCRRYGTGRPPPPPPSKRTIVMLYPVVVVIDAFHTGYISAVRS